MVSGGVGNTGMRWKLGKSSITLTDDERGNAVQFCDLGSSGVHLQQLTSPSCHLYVVYKLLCNRYISLKLLKLTLFKQRVSFYLREREPRTQQTVGTFV